MKSNFTKLILFLCLPFFISCGTGKPEFDFNEYAKECVKAFTNATIVFFDGNYAEARDLLIKYNQLDSLEFDYESYAFLAETFNRLGKPDSGKIVYQNIINKLNKDIKEDPRAVENKMMAIQDLEKWYADYPKFPEELKKENGFIPYDIMPEPIGGVAAVQNNVVYPVLPENERTSGRVLVGVLVNEKGDVADVKILRSLNQPYDKSAMNAVKKIKFTPHQRKGRLKSIWIAIPIVFK